MSEKQKPDADLIKLQEGEPVIAVTPDFRESLQAGKVQSSNLNDVWVSVQGLGAHLSSRQKVFNHSEIAGAAADMLPSGKGEDAEVHLASEIKKLMSDPESRTELAMKLGTKVMDRNDKYEPSDEDLGLATVDQLISDDETHGVGNIEKIRGLIEGIKSGRFSNGANNYLYLCHLNRYSEQVSTERREELKTKMYGINLEAVNRIYEMFEAKLENADVYEKHSHNRFEKVRFIPAPGGFYFRETKIFDRDDLIKEVPLAFGVDIIAGPVPLPEQMYESDYSPSAE